MNIESQQMLTFDQNGPLYLHILGFSTKGRKILQEIKNKSALRLLNRGSDIKAVVQDNSHPALQAMLGLDVQTTDLYTLLYPCPSARRGALDYITSPVRLNN